MADPRIPAGPLGEFRELIKGITRRLDELEKPTGTQLSQAVKKILELFETLDQTVRDLVTVMVGQLSYTKSQIDAQHQALNSKTWPTSQVSGMLPVGQGGTGSGNAYHQDLATTTRRAAWVGENGVIGFALSSAKRKQNIQVAEVPYKALLSLPVQTFQYRDSESELTGWDLGFVAEDLADLGLEQFLYRGAGGELEGVAYERLVFALHEALRDHEARVSLLETKNTALESAVAELTARIGALESKE